ncbi:MAG: pyridoxamine 5'-phosphate oxidase family protein [Oscillibacter sp.]|jgi:hypothetical protein|nr:pyridoxamine 5'-phosphate oxidase family protein [Oscillibacter sp.]
MTHEEFQSAAEHWSKKDALGVKMEADALKAAVEAFFADNNTCALATACGDFVRCTPIEYTWHDGAFWMFSEGGLKFFALEHNQNVCLAIYDRYDGFGSLHSAQVTGRAEMVEPFSAEYVRAAEFRKIPLAALKALPSPMHLIKITPIHIDYLCSALKEQGLNVRQTLDC